MNIFSFIIIFIVIVNVIIVNIIIKVIVITIIVKIKMINKAFLVLYFDEINMMLQFQLF